MKATTVDSNPDYASTRVEEFEFVRVVNRLSKGPPMKNMAQTTEVGGLAVVLKPVKRWILRLRKTLTIMQGL